MNPFSPAAGSTYQAVHKTYRQTCPVFVSITVSVPVNVYRLHAPVWLLKDKGRELNLKDKSKVGGDF